MPTSRVYDQDDEELDDDTTVVPPGGRVVVPASFMDSALDAELRRRAESHKLFELERNREQRLLDDAEMKRQYAYKEFKAKYRDAWRKPGSGPWGYPAKSTDSAAADGGDASDDYAQPAANVRDAEARREAAYLERNKQLQDAWRNPASGAGARSSRKAEWVR
jgi:hypothetical protein